MERASDYFIENEISPVFKIQSLLLTFNDCSIWIVVFVKIKPNNNYNYSHIRISFAINNWLLNVFAFFTLKQLKFMWNSFCLQIVWQKCNNHWKSDLKSTKKSKEFCFDNSFPMRFFAAAVSIEIVIVAIIIIMKDHICYNFNPIRCGIINCLIVISWPLAWVYLQTLSSSQMRSSNFCMSVVGLSTLKVCLFFLNAWRKPAQVAA